MIGRIKHMVFRFVGETIWLKEYSLTTKLFIFSAVLITTPVLVVGTVSYFRSTSILEEKVRSYRSQINEQVKTQIEYYLRDIEISALKVLNHPDMTEFIKDYDQQADLTESKGNVRDLLINTVYSRPDIYGVAVIMDNGLVIDTLGYRGSYAADRLTHSYWYQQVPDGNSLLISRLVKTGQEEQPVITIARKIHSPSNLESVGMLLIDVNYRRLQEIADKVNSQAGNVFFILDKNGHYVYHGDSYKIGKGSEFEHLAEILQREGDYFVDESAGEVVLSHSAPLGWRFGSIIHWGEVREGASIIGITIVLALVFCLIIAYAIGGSFAWTIIRPLRRLQKFMKKVQKGDFSERVAVESNDEIGQLTEGFNHMTEKLADLIEQVYLAKLTSAEMSLQQKEMELKILQSQINPHFLCNSLENIRGMALSAGQNDIAVMAASLGSLLRYNLNTLSPTVVLQEEVNFCKVYLRIQQIRFDKNVTYDFDIPVWAHDALIVKFSLQPLVENCFIHGVGAGKQLTKILIAAKEEQSDIIIQVKDNGVGISEETLKKIRHDLVCKDITTGGHNIGIVNVQRRIVNLFGDEYGLYIESTLGEGTVVTLRLPLIKAKKGEQCEEDSTSR